MLGSGTIFPTCLVQGPFSPSFPVSFLFSIRMSGRGMTQSRILKSCLLQRPRLPQSHPPHPRHCFLPREKMIESSGKRDIPARDEVSLNEGLWEGGEHTRFISVA